MEEQKSSRRSASERIPVAPLSRSRTKLRDLETEKKEKKKKKKTAKIEKKGKKWKKWKSILLGTATWSELDEPAQPAQRFPYVDVRRLQYRPQRLAPSTLPTFSSPDWWKAWPGWSVLGIRNLSDAHCALEKIDQQDAVAVVFRLILRIFSPQEVIDNQAYLSSVEEREIR
ncbi:hypothetical protein LTR28_007010 [Elasticomyces elasticus]|nr:hypothetical protein LTR28_007010 [Elasticomyces elasticus]